jgi:DUF4097 and DUF4098 domain-containing protein YvlB
MMDTRLPLVLLSAALLSAPLNAAVTNRLPAPDDTPRTLWLERYTEARQGPEETDRQVQSFKVGADAALDLSNISGDVQVTGDGGNEIRIEATKRVRHRDTNEARRLLQQLRVEMVQIGGRIEVRTVYPRRNESNGERNISARVDYVITVPVAAAVAVKTISGNAGVAKVNGEVRAETVSGDVTVTGTPNVAVARTVSGDVLARDIGGATSLSLSTVSGTVTASGLKARSLECGAVSGNIDLSGVEVERLLAKSVSGDIQFGAVLARGGRYEFGAHSGNIRVILGSDTGFELDASTFSGSVRSDFPVTLRSQAGSSRDRRDANRTIRGAYGDAGAILSIKTFSGTVVISRK